MVRHIQYGREWLGRRRLIITRCVAVGRKQKCIHAEYQWTSEKPTGSGWYWFREPSLPIMGVLVQVKTSCIRLGNAGDASLDKVLGGEWFGPLEMPE